MLFRSGGCEGVEIPFCEDVSRKGTGRAVWRALRYGGICGGGGGAGYTGDDENSYKGGNPTPPSCEVSGSDGIGSISYISLYTKPVLGF